MEWVGNNYEWLFSGAGVALIMFFIGKSITKNKKIGQNQCSGESSTNIQAGGNITFKESDSER